MKCYYHPTVDSVQSCSVCRKLLCQACAHSIKGKTYCQDCLVAGTELAALAASTRIATYSPARAALFALVPGIGAVYNRQYAKALVHFAIFASLIIIAGEAGLEIFGFAAFAFYIFTIMDAYRSAQVMVRKQVAQGEVIQEEFEKITTPLWGGILVILGILFFLNNLGFNSFRFIAQFWPLIFVAIGIYLIFDYCFKPSPPAPPPGPAVQPPPVAKEDDR